MSEAVRVSLMPPVGHGVHGQRNVESRLIRLTRRGLHTGAGGDASDDNLRYAVRLELGFKIGTGKGAPCSLGYRDVAGLPAEFRGEGRSIASDRFACAVARCGPEHLRPH